MRLLPSVVVAAALAVLVPGVAGASPVHAVTAGGTFTAYAPGAHAVTYRPDLVPLGARAHVFSLSAAHAGTTTSSSSPGCCPAVPTAPTRTYSRAAPPVTPPGRTSSTRRTR